MSETKSGIFYGWYIVAASFITLFMTTGIGFYTFSVFMLPLEQHFATTRTAITGFNSIMALIAGFATPAIGMLVHSWGPRKVIGLGAVVTGGGYLLLSRATEVSHLYFLAFLIGVGLSATTLIPNQTIVSHWFVRKRGSAMGIAMIGIAAGGIFWAPFAHTLIERFRWQGAFIIFGLAIPLVIVPLAIFVIRRSPQSIGLSPDGDGGALPLAGSDATAAGPGAPQLTVPQSVRTASFWYLFLVNFFMVLGTSIITAHIVGILADSPLGEGIGREEAMRIGSRVIPYFLVVSIAGRVLGGYLAERFSKRHLMALLYGILILSGIILFQLKSFPALYVFVLLYGIGMGGSAVIYPLILAENFGLLSFSKLLGIMGIPFTLGAAIGQVGAARIYDTMRDAQASNPYAGVFLLLIAVFAVSTILILLAKPPHMVPVPGLLPAEAAEQESAL